MPDQKDAPTVRIIPPAVPLIVILLGLCLNRVWPLHLGFEIPAPARYWLGGAIVAGAVLGLGFRSIRLFHRTGQSEVPWTPATELLMRGPYGFTRNPLYLQLVIVSIGFAVILMNWWILLLTPLGAWVLQRFAILPEEAYLERKFGDSYLAYKRQVRRWL